LVVYRRIISDEERAVTSGSTVCPSRTAKVERKGFVPPRLGVVNPACTAGKAPVGRQWACRAIHHWGLRAHTCFNTLVTENRENTRARARASVLVARASLRIYTPTYTYAKMCNTNNTHSKRLTYTSEPWPEWTRHEHADEPRADVSPWRAFARYSGVYTQVPLFRTPRSLFLRPLVPPSRHPASFHDRTG